MRKFALAAVFCALGAVGASAQQANQTARAPAPTTADFLAQGYEIKGVVNNTFLLLQKGDRAFLCGSPNPNLTWSNWAEITRDATCTSMTNAATR
jgi:hypothetical protein